MFGICDMYFVDKFYSILLINFILKSRLIWKMLSINFYVVSGIERSFTMWLSNEKN